MSLTTLLFTFSKVYLYTHTNSHKRIHLYIYALEKCRQDPAHCLCACHILPHGNSYVFILYPLYFFHTSTFRKDAAVNHVTRRVLITALSQMHTHLVYRAIEIRNSLLYIPLIKWNDSMFYSMTVN